MNKKAQTGIGIGIVLAIAIFIIGMSVLNIIKPEVTAARSATGLNCVNATAISDGTKLTCLVVDITVPAIIWGLLSIVGGIVITKTLTLKRQ